MFHGGPEVHGDGAQLDFYRIVFVCIQTADIYAENDMMAAITVGLGALNIVSLTDENEGRAASLTCLSDYLHHQQNSR